MHISIADYNPYNLFILTIVYSKNLTTNKLLTIEQMTMFVVKYIHIQINGYVYGSINLPIDRYPKWRLDGPALSGHLLYSLVNHAYANRYHNHLVR